VVCGFVVQLFSDVYVHFGGLLVSGVARSAYRQNVTDWTGAQHPGFGSLSYVLKQFYRKNRVRGPPTPPAAPLSGNVGVERGVAA
jgi:hypothetical protein